MRVRLGVLVCSLGAACAPVPDAARAARTGPDGCYACAELEAEAPRVAEADGAAARSASTDALAFEVPEHTKRDRWSTTRIGAEPAAAAPRPRRAKKVSVELARAPFADAARMLADAGRFDLVLEAPSATEVTVSLRDIDPYDALVLIAEAKGLSVRTTRGVVVVAP